MLFVRTVVCVFDSINHREKGEKEQKNVDQLCQTIFARLSERNGTCS